MKYILTNQDGFVFGPFTTVEQISNGYLCDGDVYQTSVIGTVTESEVSDDYMSPTQITTFNNDQSELRAAAYPVDSDPIFFQYQRGQKTQQDWLDAVDAVQAKYPYKT